MAKSKILNVKGIEIIILRQYEEDYLSLTDMLKAKDGDFFISDWLRNRNTIEFLGIWERVNNPDFNYGEFAAIKSQAGLNSYKISVKEWVGKTKAIGIKATAGRYGGTYAHKDIAFEFGMWISPEFKIYLIKEFQRLKNDESDRLKLEWNLQRTLAKVNYRIHTDAIKENLVPKELTRVELIGIDGFNRTRMTRIRLIKTDLMVLVRVTNLTNEKKKIRINPSYPCHQRSIFLPYIL